MTALDNRIQASTISKRDNLGLCEGIKYEFKESGKINWRAMVNPEFVYPNEKWFTERKKDIPDSTAGLDDEQCIVSLAGLKELLSLRGYENLDFEVLKDSSGEITAKCSITFSPNYETDGKPVTRSDIATAGAFNVHKDYQVYTHTIAANRAMARCIRNFLNIHVVSKEEIGDITQEPEKKTSTGFDPFHILMDRINKASLNEEDVKIICAKSSLDTSWVKLSDMSDNGSFCRKLLSALNKS